MRIVIWNEKFFSRQSLDLQAYRLGFYCRLTRLYRNSIWLQNFPKKYTHFCCESYFMTWKIYLRLFLHSYDVEVNQTSATADVTTEFIEKLKKYWECLHNISPRSWYISRYFSPTPHKQGSICKTAPINQEFVELNSKSISFVNVCQWSRASWGNCDCLRQAMLMANIFSASAIRIAIKFRRFG